MNQKPQLMLHAVGGVFLLLIIYTLRDSIVIGLVGAGAIYLYKLTTGNNHRPR